ncbi:hypothetical protein Mpal_1171 [Methanosphaerula palustris E1-9c]|uniref:Uncharacterized protein n=1 Tax=Methanosphaerula palustris (strain ATCC BAA-1556 / DSM 19958 / E1-9c) TaxID=521011 RepID=B8GHA8_METPE|nr:hypothetical protein Mpal_1171 [Methanosphaerula palustris E1-9c]
MIGDIFRFTGKKTFILTRQRFERIQEMCDLAGLFIQPFVPFNLCPCHKSPDRTWEIHTPTSGNG